MPLITHNLIIDDSDVIVTSLVRQSLLFWERANATYSE